MSLQPADTGASEMHGTIPTAEYMSLFQTSKPIRDFSKPFIGKIPSHWSEAAKKNGFKITKRVQDRLHVSLLCHTCGSEHRKRVSVILRYKPECPHCISAQRVSDARNVGARLLGRDPKNRHYGHYRAECGHQIRRQFHRVTMASQGGHDLGCETCREQRYAEQSRKWSWGLIGPANNMKAGYRLYQHSCGQLQDIAVVNMMWGDCACKQCSPGRTAKPSWIYVFRIDLPMQTVVKLGYSARPEKRLKHQLGLSKAVVAEVVRLVKMPTGYDARNEEEHAHRALAEQQPELIVPKSEFRDAINTQGEIYRIQAEPLIHLLLDEIESRFQDKNA